VELEREIHEVMDLMKVEKAQAVRTILEMGIAEWRKRTALELLRDGKVTFVKAAQVAELDVWDFADLVKEKKIEWIRFTRGEVEEDVRKAAKAAAK
jgi:predicted HTH domain antitoxin